MTVTPTGWSAPNVARTCLEPARRRCHVTTPPSALAAWLAAQPVVRRRSFISLSAATIALRSRPASAQRSKPPRVALVFNRIPVAEMVGAEPSNPAARSFMHGLREQGLVDGRDLVVERHSAEGRMERLPALMQELVGSGIDVIVTIGAALAAAIRATDRVAIVAVAAADPVDSGLVADLRRPGGNLTGIGEHSLQTIGKELQLLKEAVPSVAVLAMIDGRGPSALAVQRRRAALQGAADRLQLRLRWLDVDSPAQLDAALETIARERPDGLLVYVPSVTTSQRQRIADFALRQRMPSVGWPDLGMLMAYEADEREMYRRAAAIVKRILDGAKPGDVPFEQPTKFNLTINLRTAKALGLNLPRSLLLRADELIE